MEKNWLKTHPEIRIAGPKAFPPFHYYENGRLKGISADYIKLISKYLGIKIVIQEAEQWNRVLEKVKKKQVDVIACIAKIDERETYLNFSQPYLSFPLVIITRKDAPFISGIQDLYNRKITVIKKNIIPEQLEKDGVEYIPFYVSSPLDGLKKVSFGRADAQIENLAAASFLIQKNGLTNLKIAAPTHYGDYRLYMAVRDDWPILTRLINKSLAAMTREQHSRIKNDWLSIRYEHGVDKKQVVLWIITIILFCAVLISVVLFWNQRLKKEVQNRKKTENRLRRSEKRFREIIEEVSEIAIQGYDEKRRVTFWNNASEELYGFSNDQALGKKLEDLIIPDDMREQVIQFHHDWIDKGKKIPAGALELVDKEKKMVPVFSSHVMHETEDGYEMFCIDLNLKPIQEAQKIANEQNKMALVGQIAGKMAHDFNNILSIILGTTELAILDCEEPELKKALKMILEQSIRGKNLTRNLVIFAKDQEPRQEFFFIQDKIHLVCDLLKKDLSSIDVTIENDPKTPRLLADPGMIEHALVNLLQNAVHALSKTETPKIYIKTLSANDQISISIKDNGCGIPTEHLAHIHDPSFTLKGSCDITKSYRTGIKGAGYGMSNVKKYIEQHHGSIMVSSQTGEGTRFTIKLPVAQEELSLDDIEELKKERTFFQKNILLVEDEITVSNIQTRILSQAPIHHKVDVAQDAKTALEMFDGDRHDLVSLDYILPGEKNGLDVYHEIRKRNKKIPILFISGNIEFLESIKLLKQKDPYIEHVSKPCLNREYIKQINHLFERVSLPDQPV